MAKGICCPCFMIDTTRLVSFNIPGKKIFTHMSFWKAIPKVGHSGTVFGKLKELVPKFSNHSRTGALGSLQGWLVNWAGFLEGARLSPGQVPVEVNADYVDCSLKSSKCTVDTAHNWHRGGLPPKWHGVWLHPSSSDHIRARPPAPGCQTLLNLLYFLSNKTRLLI